MVVAADLITIDTVVEASAGNTTIAPPMIFNDNCRDHVAHTEGARHSINDVTSKRRPWKFVLPACRLIQEREKLGAELGATITQELEAT